MTLNAASVPEVSLCLLRPVQRDSNCVLEGNNEPEIYLLLPLFASLERLFSLSGCACGCGCVTTVGEVGRSQPPLCQK